MVASKRGRANLFGNQVYITLAQRDAHPLHARKEQIQLFYVVETGKTYQLVGGKGNAHWAEYLNELVLPTPFAVKRSYAPTGPIEHDGTTNGMLRAMFSPFLEPALITSLGKTYVEVGTATDITHSVSFDAKGEETVWRNWLIQLNGATIHQVNTGVGGINGTQTPTPTTEETYKFDWQVEWDGNGTTNNLLIATRSAYSKYPYWFGTSATALTASGIPAAFPASRTMLTANTLDLVVTTASGESIYLVIPAGKTIASIQDNNDNGSTVPLSALALVEQANMDVPLGGTITQAYTYGVKVYKTDALGAASFNWKINLS